MPIPRMFKLSIGVLLLVFPAALYFNRTPMALQLRRPGGGRHGRICRRDPWRPGRVCPARFRSLWASVRGWGKDERRGIFQTFNWTVLSASLCLQAGTGFVDLGSALARAARLAGNDIRRLDRRAHLSRAERSKFQGCRARPAVSVRRRPGLEQFRPALALIALVLTVAPAPSTMPPATPTPSTYIQPS